MSSAVKEKWDRIYLNAVEPAPVVEVLKDYEFLLPESGLALDLACGRGTNSCFMAESGLQVEAWDISSVALSQLTERADEKGLEIKTRCIDITPGSLPVKRYDVILVSRFFDRRLANALFQALKPAGLLFYQTFTQQKTTQAGPSNPDYLLAENELLAMFSGLTLLVYRELGLTGDIEQGLRNEAQLVAQKK